MKVLVFSGSFPELSETFVINQITGLIDIGCKVNVFSLAKGQTKIKHSSYDKYNLENKSDSLYKNNPTKKEKLKHSLRNVIPLILTPGKWKKFFNVIFDVNLTTIQKIDLVNFIQNKNSYIGSYDNIIVHFGNQGFFVCKLRELGYIDGKISTIFHGYDVSAYKHIEKYKKQYQHLFKIGDLLLPISDFWKERLIKWGADDSNIFVQRMGVSVDKAYTELDNSFENKLIKVIQVGRLTEKKAILDSISAIVKARQKINVELTVIGAGELMEEARQLIDVNSAQDYIHLLGPRPQEFVQEALSDSDIFLLPSVVASDGDMEGIPVAIMEAMASGLIVVSTKHSGIPELVEDGVGGFLAEEKSPDQLADILINLSTMELERLNKIRYEAFNSVCTKFDEKKLLRQLYQRLSNV